MRAQFEIQREYNHNFIVFDSENDYCEPHFHSNIEILYVLKGEINVTINGVTNILTPGCVSIANKFDIHSYSTPSKSRVWVAIIPIEKVKYYATILEKKALKSNFCFGDTDSNSDIFKLLQEIVLLDNFDDEVNLVIEKGLSYLLLGIITRKIGLETRQKDINLDLSRRILFYLQQNFIEDIPISKLASELGYNKQYLSKFFNVFIGCSYSSYINSLRIRYAAQLIWDGEENMTEIALKSGFGSSRTFNRAFIKTYAMTPTDFKKKYISKIKYNSE